MAIAPLDPPSASPSPSDQWLGLPALAARPTDNVLVVTPQHFDHAAALIRDMVVVSWTGDPATLDAAPFLKRRILLWPAWPAPDAFQAITPAAKALYPVAVKTLIVKPADDAPDRRSPADFDPGHGAEAATWARGRLVEFRPQTLNGAPAPDGVVTRFRRTPEVTQRALELDPLPPEYSDDSLALAFTEAYGDRMRYIAKWSRWLQWTGNRWAEDGTRVAWDYAREIGRAASNRAAVDNAINVQTQKRIAQRCTDARTVYAIEKLANADRRHAAVIEQFDSDPWLLNTPGGVVDLSTGHLRPHRQDDYCTKITRATPTPGAKCPRWLAFLDRAQNGDQEIVAFLRRIAGYCMTGITRDHAMFFLHGKGRNGKGTFLNTFQWALGDYGMVAAMDTFVEKRHEAHKQDLARLHGARLVASQEVEEGQRWAENKIKSITGGDPITANYMRQNSFTYSPEFKLIAAGNNKPQIRSVDPAIAARMNLIPFTVEIPPAERDPSLPDKLRAEADGIMRWALEGCLEWQRIGLAVPESVRAATDKYLAAEDATGRWLTECCETGPNYRDRRAELYRNYKTWADASGEIILPLKRWEDSLAGKGCSEAPKLDGYPMMGGLRRRVAVVEDGRYGRD